jgi:AraC-like DNA-binding protein
MLMLPVPVFVALILAWLALRLFWSGGQSGGQLGVLLALCAAQSLLVALAAGYGVAAAHYVLPITAASIPPMTWITYRAALFRAPSWRMDWQQITAPLFCLFCRIFAPDTLDAAVVVIFAGYGVAILISLRRAGDLPLARIAAGGLPALLWWGLGWLLIGSAVCDGLIALAYMSGNADWAGGIISGFASGSLLLLGLVSSTPEAMGEDEAAAQTVVAVEDQAVESLAEDQEILARLAGFLAREKVFLDPSLTLQRLARRLHVPEKRLSAAVNRATGENVSRYINGARIDYACGLIGAGQAVTEAMLASGFNTKSNFNRAFLQAKGQSPSEWAKRGL